MSAPRLSRLGRALPSAAREAIVASARGRGPLGLLADLLLEYPPDALGFDPVRTRRSFFLVERTVCRYFRMQVLDAARIPPGRALLIGCHSGVLPWDAACVVVAIYRETGRFSRNAGHELWGRLGPVTRFLTARGVVLGPAATGRRPASAGHRAGGPPFSPYRVR